MQIRQERPQDAETIHALTTAAFKPLAYSSQTEARIIDALRAAGALSLSLVAVEGQSILGHVAFSPVKINGVSCDWFGLGPVSVWPEHQGRGIGQAVIREGLAMLESMSAKGCVLLGNPKYYGRFGFEHDPGLYYQDTYPGFFQRLVLSGVAPKGEVTYHSGFDVP